MLLFCSHTLLELGEFDGLPEGDLLVGRFDGLAVGDLLVGGFNGLIVVILKLVLDSLAILLVS